MHVKGKFDAKFIDLETKANRQWHICLFGLLVDDLLLLWSDEAEMYDAITKSTFNLKAILM